MNERVSNTGERLREIMKKYNLRQVDILTMCKPYCKQYGVEISKASLSSYITGTRSQPTQDKIYVLSKALGVSPAWLMGFDVPEKEVPENFERADALAEEMMKLFNGLNMEQKITLMAKAYEIAKEKN